MFAIFVFFIILCCSLFIGDGKQSFIDFYLSGNLILMGVLVYRKKFGSHKDTKEVLFWWIAVVSYFFLLLFTTISVSASLFWDMRLLVSSLVFLFFYFIADNHSLSSYIRGLIMFSVFAVVASGVMVVVPHMRGLLPLMNLLYAAYQHNHLASILIFTLPSFLFVVKEKKKSVMVFLFITYFLFLLTTFARAAYVIAIVYLLYLVFVYKEPGFKKILKWTLGVLLFLFLLYSVVESGFGGSTNAWIPKQFNKPPIFTDARIIYWSQAIKTFQENPLVGSGPGTFYLKSTQLQQTPGTSSWFAHSFPLQLLAESGIMGVLFFVGLSFVVCRQIYRNWKKMASYPMVEKQSFVVVSHGVVLLLVYSLVEFSLDFYVLLVLLMSALGLLAGYGVKTMPKPDLTRLYIRVGGVLVGIFLLLGCAGFVSVYGVKNRSLAYYFNPHIKKYAVSVLKESQDQQKQINSSTEKLIIFFHGSDPEVVLELAKTHEPFNLKKSLIFYKKMNIIDPFNSSYKNDYIYTLLSHYKDLTIDDKNYLNVRLNYLLKIAFYYQEKNTDYNVDYVPALSESLVFDESWGENIVFDKGFFTRLHYFIALQTQVNKFLYDNSTISKMLEIAQQLSSDWSYIYLERASFEKYIHQNEALAQKVLNECSANKYASPYCNEFSVSTLPMFGSLKKEIELIP